jgi:hypothetical protein
MIDQYGLSHYSVVTPQLVDLEIMSAETGFLKFWNWVLWRPNCCGEELGCNCLLVICYSSDRNF